MKKESKLWWEPLWEKGQKAEPSFSRARAKICYHCQYLELIAAYSEGEISDYWYCSELKMVFGPDTTSTIGLLAEMTCKWWEHCSKLEIHEKMV